MFLYKTVFCKFRTRNTSTPELASYDDAVDSICGFCNNGTGDEYHYLLVCFSLSSIRKKYLPKYFQNYPSTSKFNFLMNSNGKILINVCKFIDNIVKRLTRP